MVFIVNKKYIIVVFFVDNIALITSSEYKMKALIRHVFVFN